MHQLSKGYLIKHYIKLVAMMSIPALLCLIQREPLVYSICISMAVATNLLADLIPGWTYHKKLFLSCLVVPLIIFFTYYFSTGYLASHWSAEVVLAIIHCLFSYILAYKWFEVFGDRDYYKMRCEYLDNLATKRLNELYEMKFTKNQKTK